MNLKNKTVLFVVPNNDFRDEELAEPRRLLESKSVRTIVASKEIGDCKGIMGSKAHATLSLDKININEYDAIVLVGGLGSKIFWDDKDALNILKEADIKGKVICSICLAAGTLANSKIIRGKRVTGWPDTEKLVVAAGGIYTGSDVEVSGRIITAKGPHAAKSFGEEILKALSNEISD